MKRAVLFPSTGSRVGGSTISTALLAESLHSKSGWAVQIALPERGLNSQVFERLGLAPDYYGLGTTFVEQLRRSYGAGGKLKAVAAYWAVYRKAIRYLQERRPDIVHINDDRTLMTWGPAAQRLGIPVVWHVRQERGNRYLDRWRLKLADNLIFVADANRKRFSWTDHLPPNVTIHNGVDLMEFYAAENKDEAKRRLGLDTDRVTMGFVGNLTPRKRPEWAVRAALDLLKEDEPIELLVVGADRSRGAYDTRLRRMVAEAGFEDHIHFWGYRSDVADVMRAMDALILTSEPEGEAFPRAVIEAMASRVPVLSTAVGGTPEAIVDGETGLLADPNRYEHFYALLRGFVDDSMYRNRIAHAGYEEACRRFSQESVVDKVIDVYRGLL